MDNVRDGRSTRFTYRTRLGMPHDHCTPLHSKRTKAEPDIRVDDHYCP